MRGDADLADVPDRHGQPFAIVAAELEVVAANVRAPRPVHGSTSSPNRAIADNLTVEHVRATS